ncbi:MAG: WYL domain-containing protein [Xanthomonadaceae bacterium]|nr:WYL domain-containing protein [Xanthomonadaceae bacterium]
MKDEILSQIKEALEKKEVVSFIYKGGRDPNTILEIIPSKIEGDRVFGYCQETKKVKQYLLCKIEKPSSRYGALAYTGNKLIYQDILERLSIGDDVYIERQPLGFKIFDLKKDGSPKKYEFLSCYYNDEVMKSFYDPDNEEADFLGMVMRAEKTDYCWVINSKKYLDINQRYKKISTVITKLDEALSAREAALN